MNAFEGSPPPTILQIVPALETGGAERTTLDIAAAILKAGGRALVASRGGRMVEELLGLGAEHFELAMHSKNPVIMALNVERLTRLAARERVSLLHARSRAPAWSALAAARRLNLPFVTTYHSKVHAVPRVKVFYNSVMARGDAVIANSHFTADQIRKIHNPREGKVFVVPRGVDTDIFSEQAVSPARLAQCRRDLGLIDDGALVFLLPARLSEWKGQKIAIEAAVRLRQQAVPPFRLVLLGDAQGRDKYRAELLAAANSAGLQDIVLLPGHGHDMPAAYCLSDAVLAPSLQAEPFGRAPIEAGAMARLTIASDAGGMRETVKSAAEAGPDEATGFRVPPGNAAALADAMREVLLMPDADRRAMGERARAFVGANYSLQSMCDQTLSIYARLLKRD